MILKDMHMHLWHRTVLRQQPDRPRAQASMLVPCCHHEGCVQGCQGWSVQQSCLAQQPAPSEQCAWSVLKPQCKLPHLSTCPAQQPAQTEERLSSPRMQQKVPHVARGCLHQQMCTWGSIQAKVQAVHLSALLHAPTGKFLSSSAYTLTVQAALQHMHIMQQTCRAI